VKLIKKHGKKIALLLSVVLLATAVIGGTLAYVVTKTPSLLNTFIADHSGDILIRKTVEHPFGNNYVIPDGIDFDFAVNLGEGYANQDVTVITASEQNGTVVKANADGVITVSIKPGQTAIIKDVTVGTEVEVKEDLSKKPGFSVQGEPVRTVTVGKGENTLEYTNVYAPAPAPANLTVGGTKVIEGREWIDDDSFTFELEKYNKANEEWEKLGETAAAYNVITVQEDGKDVIKPDPDMDKFSFAEPFVDGNGQSIFTEAGTYSFRIREEDGTIPGLVYDTTDYAFDVLVEDKDMDGALEIKSVTPADSSLNNLYITGTTDDGFDVEATVTNRYAPEGSAQVTIEIKKQVVSNSGEDKSPEGFIFELFDKAGKPVGDPVSSSSTGDAKITLEYGPEDAGKSFDYILKEKDDAQPGWDYDDTEYPITVNVVDNNDGTISAYISETEADNDDDDDSSTSSGSDVSGASAGDDQQDGGQQDDGQQDDGQQDDGQQDDGQQSEGQQDDGQQDDGQQDDGQQDDGQQSEGQQQDGEGTINTAASNASQSTTVYLTAKRLPNTHSSVTQLTAEETEVILDPGAAQINLSSGQNGGETVYKAAFTNIYTPVPAQGESIPGKKVLNGRSIKANEFEFELWTVDDDGDRGDKLCTVFNDADGNFAIDMSIVSYDKVGTYKYAVVEADGDLGGVTYDESRFDITVTVKDNNGTLETETVIKDKLGAKAEYILFTNEYVPAKISFAIGGKKELKGDAYSGEAFGFSLYKANNPAEFIKEGTAIETVTKSEAGDFTFTAIEYTEVGTHYYLVEEVKGSVSGMEYDSTVYGVVVSVTDDGSGQLAAAITKLVKIGGSDVEEILFSNTYTKPVVTPTPTIPVTPTPTPGITPTPPLDDVEIPIYPGESDVPPTGDDNPIGLYVAILLISIAAIAVLMVTGKNGRRSGRRKKRARAR